MGSIGYLVGKENKGLAYMFHMMNEARIAVGGGAVAQGYAGYLTALEYARIRTQGRPIAGEGSERADGADHRASPMCAGCCWHPKPTSKADWHSSCTAASSSTNCERRQGSGDREPAAGDADPHREELALGMVPACQ